jgi:hypothetical protein
VSILNTRLTGTVRGLPFFYPSIQRSLWVFFPPSMSSTDLYGNWAYGLDDSHEDLILAMQSARTLFRAGRPAGSAFRESIARAVVPQFFMRCQELSALPDAANSSLHKRDLDRVIEYIKSNLTRRLTVAEIAGYFE